MTMQGTRERFDPWDQPEAAGALAETDYDNPGDADYGKPGYPTIGPIPPRMPAWALDQSHGVTLAVAASAPEPVPAAVPEAPTRAGNGRFLPGNPGRGKTARKLPPARTRPETGPR